MHSIKTIRDDEHWVQIIKTSKGFDFSIGNNEQPKAFEIISYPDSFIANWDNAVDFTLILLKNRHF